MSFLGFNLGLPLLAVVIVSRMGSGGYWAKLPSDSAATE